MDLKKMLDARSACLAEEVGAKFATSTAEMNCTQDSDDDSLDLDNEINVYLENLLELPVEELMASDKDEPESCQSDKAVDSVSAVLATSKPEDTQMHDKVVNYISPGPRGHVAVDSHEESQLPGGIVNGINGITPLPKETVKPISDLTKIFLKMYEWKVHQETGSGKVTEVQEENKTALKTVEHHRKKKHQKTEKQDVYIISSDSEKENSSDSSLLCDKAIPGMSHRRHRRNMALHNLPHKSAARKRTGYEFRKESSMAENIITVDLESSASSMSDQETIIFPLQNHTSPYANQHAVLYDADSPMRKSDDHNVTLPRGMRSNSQQQEQPNSNGDQSSVTDSSSQCLDIAGQCKSTIPSPLFPENWMQNGQHQMNSLFCMHDEERVSSSLHISQSPSVSPLLHSPCKITDTSNTLGFCVSSSSSVTNSNFKQNSWPQSYSSPYQRETSSAFHSLHSSSFHSNFQCHQHKENWKRMYHHDSNSRSADSGRRERSRSCSSGREERQLPSERHSSKDGRSSLQKRMSLWPTATSQETKKCEGKMEERKMGNCKPVSVDKDVMSVTDMQSQQVHMLKRIPQREKEDMQSRSALPANADIASIPLPPDTVEERDWLPSDRYSSFIKNTFCLGFSFCKTLEELQSSKSETSTSDEGKGIPSSLCMTIGQRHASRCTEVATRYKHATVRSKSPVEIKKDKKTHSTGHDTARNEYPGRVVAASSKLTGTLVEGSNTSHRNGNVDTEMQKQCNPLPLIARCVEDTSQVKKCAFGATNHNTVNQGKKELRLHCVDGAHKRNKIEAFGEIQHEHDVETSLGAPGHKKPKPEEVKSNRHLVVNTSLHSQKGKPGICTYSDSNSREEEVRKGGRTRDQHQTPTLAGGKTVHVLPELQPKANITKMINGIETSGVSKAMKSRFAMEKGEANMQEKCADESKTQSAVVAKKPMSSIPCAEQFIGNCKSPVSGRRVNVEKQTSPVELLVKKPKKNKNVKTENKDEKLEEKVKPEKDEKQEKKKDDVKPEKGEKQEEEGNDVKPGKDEKREKKKNVKPEKDEKQEKKKNEKWEKKKNVKLEKVEKQVKEKNEVKPGKDEKWEKKRNVKPEKDEKHKKKKNEKWEKWKDDVKPEKDEKQEKEKNNVKPEKDEKQEEEKKNVKPEKDEKWVKEKNEKREKKKDEKQEKEKNDVKPEKKNNTKLVEQERFVRPEEKCMEPTQEKNFELEKERNVKSTKARNDKWEKNVTPEKDVKQEEKKERNEKPQEKCVKQTQEKNVELEKERNVKSTKERNDKWEENATPETDVKQEKERNEKPWKCVKPTQERNDKWEEKNGTPENKDEKQEEERNVKSSKERNENPQEKCVEQTQEKNVELEKERNVKSTKKRSDKSEKNVTPEKDVKQEEEGRNEKPEEKSLKAIKESQIIKAVTEFVKQLPPVGVEMSNGGEKFSVMKGTDCQSNNDICRSVEESSMLEMQKFTSSRRDQSSDVSSASSRGKGSPAAEYVLERHFQETVSIEGDGQLLNGLEMSSGDCDVQCGAHNPLCPEAEMALAGQQHGNMGDDAMRTMQAAVLLGEGQETGIEKANKNGNESSGSAEGEGSKIEVCVPLTLDHLQNAASESEMANAVDGPVVDEVQHTQLQQFSSGILIRDDEGRIDDDVSKDKSMAGMQPLKHVDSFSAQVQNQVTEALTCAKDAGAECCLDTAFKLTNKTATSKSKWSTGNQTSQKVRKEQLKSRKRKGENWTRHKSRTIGCTRAKNQRLIESLRMETMQTYYRLSCPLISLVSEDYKLHSIPVVMLTDCIPKREKNCVRRRCTCNLRKTVGMVRKLKGGTTAHTYQLQVKLQTSRPGSCAEQPPDKANSEECGGEGNSADMKAKFLEQFAQRFCNAKRTVATQVQDGNCGIENEVTEVCVSSSSNLDFLKRLEEMLKEK